MTQPKEYLRIHEVAARLGFSYKTVYRLIRDGKLAASKPALSYLIRPEDVERLLEQGRLEPVTALAPGAPTGPAETLRCGRCLRVIANDRGVGGMCAHPRCDEILCAACWGPADSLLTPTPERLCYRHTPLREQRLAAALRQAVTGQQPKPVLAAEARRLELAFVSRFEHKLRQVVTLKNPVSGAIYRNLCWDNAYQATDASQEMMSLLHTGFLDAQAQAEYPLNTRSTFVVSGPDGGVTLEARVLCRLERHLADGFDGQPLGADDVLRALQTTLKQLGRKAPRAFVLGLASPTGWSAQAIDYVTSAEPGQGFAHAWLLPYLIDLRSGQVYRNALDSRLSALEGVFTVLLPEEEVQAVVKILRTALLRSGSLSGAQAVAETQAAEPTVLMAFEQLARTGLYATVELPGVGTMLTRR